MPEKQIKKPDIPAFVKKYSGLEERVIAYYEAVSSGDKKTAKNALTNMGAYVSTVWGLEEFRNSIKAADKEGNIVAGEMLRAMLEYRVASTKKPEEKWKKDDTATVAKAGSEEYNSTNRAAKKIEKER